MLQKTFQRCFPYNKLLSRIANEREAPGPSPKSAPEDQLSNTNYIRAAPKDVVFEPLWLNPQTGRGKGGSSVFLV